MAPAAEEAEQLEVAADDVLTAPLSSLPVRDGCEECPVKLEIIQSLREEVEKASTAAAESTSLAERQLRMKLQVKTQLRRELQLQLHSCVEGLRRTGTRYADKMKGGDRAQGCCPAEWKTPDPAAAADAASSGAPADLRDPLLLAAAARQREHTRKARAECDQMEALRDIGAFDVSRPEALRLVAQVHAALSENETMSDCLMEMGEKDYQQRLSGNQHLRQSVPPFSDWPALREMHGYARRLRGELGRTERYFASVATHVRTAESARPSGVKRERAPDACEQPGAKRATG